MQKAVSQPARLCYFLGFAVAQEKRYLCRRYCTTLPLLLKPLACATLFTQMHVIVINTGELTHSIWTYFCANFVLMLVFPLFASLLPCSIYTLCKKTLHGDSAANSEEPVTSSRFGSVILQPLQFAGISPIKDWFLHIGSNRQKLLCKALIV